MEEFIWKFFKFGLVGVTGIIVDFGLTWLCREKLRINQYLSNSIGFMSAVVNNFILNRIWTFNSQDPSIALQFGKFLLVALVGLALNNGIVYVLNERKGFKFYPAKLIATAVVVLWNFGANYTFTFKR